MSNIQITVLRQGVLDLSKKMTVARMKQLEERELPSPQVRLDL